MFTSVEEPKKTAISTSWISWRCSMSGAEMVMETLSYRHLHLLQILILITEVKDLT
ncbi:MAG: hypothetical protein WC699_15895 [Bacteroidales bacterium]|jgi:hypothetical protein